HWLTYATAYTDRRRYSGHVGPISTSTRSLLCGNGQVREVEDTLRILSVNWIWSRGRNRLINAHQLHNSSIQRS
ncbi:unnamed protein product, partial [Nesidiocoris tenuis]